MLVHTIVNSAANGGRSSDRAPITVNTDAASTKLLVASGELTEPTPGRFRLDYIIYFYKYTTVESPR